MNETSQRGAGALALGIDIGTTAIKICLVDAEGRVVGSGAAVTVLETGPGGRVEQDPENIWDGIVHSVRAAFEEYSKKKTITGLSLSSQGGALLLFDEDDAPIGNAISWMDSRPGRMVEPAFDTEMQERLYRKTGWSSRNSLPLAQLIRMQHEEPEKFNAIGRVEFIDSYLVRRLTGESVCSRSDAAITMLYDLESRDWDESVLTMAGAERIMLPDVRNSGSVVGKVRAEPASDLGISQDTEVVVGAHDQYCAAYGAGCRRAGDTIVSCGTAWVLLTMAEQKLIDEKARMAPAEAVPPRLWGLLGSSPQAGASVDWFRSAVTPSAETVPFEEFERAAGEVAPSTENPVFIPAMERGESGGEFLNLALDHSFGHLARSVLEGAALCARRHLERMELAGAAPSLLKAVGGATRSDLWMQILADVTGLPLEVAGYQEAASYGAALIAGQNTELLPAEFEWPGPSRRFEPRSETTELYSKIFERLGTDFSR
ncbi:MAG: xylulokinase [Candidatus Brocadiia bacterium]